MLQFHSKSTLSRFGLLLTILAACTAGVERETDRAAEPQPEVIEPEPPRGTPYAVMTTSEGTVTIRLRPDLAPETVANFIELGNEGFYYNSLFHRIIPGTIIQGGDPNSKDNNPYNDGQGNSGRFLSAEFSEEPFKRGTVAMARQPGDPHSASCQFFICLKRMEHWDGEYTVFGEVIDGIETVEKMSNSPRSKDPNLSSRPTARLAIKRVKIEYRETDPAGS